MDGERSRTAQGQTWQLLLGWVVAAVLAVAVGVLAVTLVRSGVTERGPVGGDLPEADRPEGVVPSAEPAGDRVVSTFHDIFGSFTAACRGVVAYGVRAEPTNGWSTVSYEEGPDDDVDAVFVRRGQSVELEVFCNRGRPTLGDREVKTLPDDD